MFEVYELADLCRPFPRRYLTTCTADQVRDIFGLTPAEIEAGGSGRIAVELLPAFMAELIEEATGIISI